MDLPMGVYLKNDKGAEGIPGISTKSLSPCRDNDTSCIGRSIRTAIRLIFSYSAIVTKKRRNASFAAYSKAKAGSPAG